MACESGYCDIYNTVSIGLFFAVIGYEFLLFGYFLLFRFRKSKRVYWFYFSMFFIFLAISRVGYLFYDYFTPGNTLAWRFATIMGWVAVAALSGILSTLLFTGDSKLSQVLKKIFPIVPLAIAVHIIFVPDLWIFDPSGFFGKGITYIYSNAIILPLYIVLLPFMFFYLAKRSAGTLQRSFLMNGFGLLLYYAIRLLQGLGTVTLWTPLLILLAILIIVYANQYEHLK